MQAACDEAHMQQTKHSPSVSFQQSADANLLALTGEGGGLPGVCIKSHQASSSCWQP